jgi:hypothetical protein
MAPLIFWRFTYFNALLDREDCLEALETMQKFNSDLERAIEVIKKRMGEFGDDGKGKS